MKNVFIADKKLINSEDCKSWGFQDSLIVYSYKNTFPSLPVNNIDGLKEVVNVYKQLWENIIYEGIQPTIEDYSALMESFDRLGMVSNITGNIGIVETQAAPSKEASNISVYLKDFDGEVILWKDDVTGENHLLGFSEDKNFFTVNNYI